MKLVPCIELFITFAKEVMFSPLSVCLSCLDFSETTDQIFIKFVEW